MSRQFQWTANRPGRALELNTEREFPRRGRLAGIDFGTVRVGIAVCDPDRILSSPLQVYCRHSEPVDADFFCRLVDAEAIAGWVVGLPVHMSGDESQKSQEARRFGDWLARTTQRPVCFQDERFTSQEADQVLGGAGLKGRKARDRRDMLAAQAILSRFLESGTPDPPNSIA